ncbi:DUF3759 domain-containing protein [Yinghuangia sp. YIM S09857]|uniref:DUF3759 domain-containing protein n=1 Tax=Yinghuangia sp. YIM S09857 TaxID=3436929 RepID=UPI003F52A0B7
MALFPDDSEEAARFHECRSAPHGERVDADLLAQAGAYAGAMAWDGHVAHHGRPRTLAGAHDLAVQAADAFIDETAKERGVSADDVRRAKERAGEKLSGLLRGEYA